MQGGIDVGDTLTTVHSGLNVGSPSANAGSGQVRADGSILSETNVQTVFTDAGTNTVAGLLGLTHLSTGTPTAGFGGAITFAAADAGGTSRVQGQVICSYVAATVGAHTSFIRLVPFDFVGAREGIRITANGSAAQVGFFGSAGSAKLTISGVRSGTLAQLQSVVASMLAALAAHGFWTDATT